MQISLFTHLGNCYFTETHCNIDTHTHIYGHTQINIHYIHAVYTYIHT